MTLQIGFMQGRLCEPVDGKIQSFPWRDWQAEFLAAAAIDLHLMEWTLDQERLYDNPLMTLDGQKKIRALCHQFDISIPSLTGDCFMQAPLWKAQSAQRIELEHDFVEIIKGCAAVRIGILVLPLVDNGRLESAAQEDALVDFLESKTDFLAAHGLRMAFESDYKPQELERFIARLNPILFGINYDIGNSAALGFNPQEEFAAYGPRVINVHVKDRVLGGATVPLGSGSANFDAVFAALSQSNYQGNFILQTARAANGNHADTLCTYRDMTIDWLKLHAT